MKNNKIQEIVDYILTWLCYEDTEAACRVAYTANEKELETHDVIIVPNGKLGDVLVLPDMGPVRTEHPAKGKTIIRTDIVYNTFFFISRAEETFNTERDEHDRFLARYSLLSHQNRLQIPLLDEYARLLLKQLNHPLPSVGFNHIYLTHDIDSIAQYRHLRGAIGGILRGQARTVCAARKDIHNDPYYTFPWLIEQESRISGAECIYFIKHTQGKGFDYPQYPLRRRDYRTLRQQLLDSGARLGLHSSYSGDLPNKKELEGSERLLHRSHYLRGSVSFLKKLVKAGYTDDFTMGFADEAGFRLQTTRAVRWINPYTYKLMPLTLHPLIVMDTTLSNEKYMHLSEDEAYFLCERLIEKVRMHHGDLCLLWHNSSFTPDTYHRSLYTKILQLTASV